MIPQTKISKLSFLSKVLKKVAFDQLSGFLRRNCILDKYQSGFRVKHSIDFALIKVSNYLLLAVDFGKSAILVLLDFSAAFDTKEIGGLQNTALESFSSYLKGRTFSVEIGNNSSASVSITCGVPQGPILGYILFLLLSVIFTV